MGALGHPESTVSSLSSKQGCQDPGLRREVAGWLCRVHGSAPLCGRKLELGKAIGTVYAGRGHGGVGAVWGQCGLCLDYF